MLEFPKNEFYSNPKVKLEKNLLKGLKKLNDEKQNLITSKLTSIENTCKAFENPNILKNKFKEIKNKINKNVKSLPIKTTKEFPIENIFVKWKRHTKCESCLKSLDLHESHVIRKKFFRKPYSKWGFLCFHPINILFLCDTCHKRFDGRGLDNHDEKVPLKPSRIKRLNMILRKRARKIKKTMKSDEKYLKSYKKSIDNFDAQKRNMLNKLLKHL